MTVGKAPYSATNIDLEVISVSPHQVLPWAGNPRKHFADDQLRELADSIARHGIQQPPVVRPIPADDPILQTISGPGEFFYLIMGERRWRAAKLAGLDAMPVRVRRDVDDHAALELALVENLQRQDLDPIEEAEGYRQLNRVIGLKQADIAAAVNRSQPAIANAMRLLDLPDDVRERIRAGELSVSHGVALAKWKDFPVFASNLARWAIDDVWTAKRLDGTKPDEWELQNSYRRPPIVRNLHVGGGVGFDTTICQSCPFHGHWKTDDMPWQLGYCLNPDHFDQLAAEAKAVREAAAQAALAAAVAEGAEGGALPKVADMATSSFEWLHVRPAGCSDDCPCRTKVENYGGTTTFICCDPRRFRGLKKAQEAAESKAKRERKAADTAAVSAAIDAITARDPAGRRELVVLVAHLIDGRTTLAKEAVKRLGIALDIDIISSYAYQQRGKRYRALFRLADRDLVRLGVEILLREDIKQTFEYGGNSGGRTAWYLQGGADDDEAAESAADD